jgi:hypothetical protein
MADTSGELLFPDATGAKTLSLCRARECVDTYLAIDDRLLSKIETSTKPALAGARRHLERIQRQRRLYKRLRDDTIAYDEYTPEGQNIAKMTHVSVCT